MKEDLRKRKITVSELDLMGILVECELLQEDLADPMNYEPECLKYSIDEIILKIHKLVKEKV